MCGADFCGYKILVLSFILVLSQCYRRARHHSRNKDVVGGWWWLSPETSSSIGYYSDDKTRRSVRPTAVEPTPTTEIYIIIAYMANAASLALAQMASIFCRIFSASSFSPRPS